MKLQPWQEEILAREGNDKQAFFKHFDHHPAAAKIRTMKPIGKYIVINTIEEEVETSSGLLLSAEDTKQLRYKKGVVVASGTDVNAIASGDTIYYDKSSGFSLVIHQKQYTVIQERDVVVVV